MINFAELDFNEEFASAFEALENTGQHMYITGKAGTGKSTLLQYFRQKTSKNVAVLAPTGVAAINIKGQTIHSFFGFKPDVTPESVGDIPVRKHRRKMYVELNAIIIDEISMVRADLMDCVDIFLRLYGPHYDRPFGGIQMIFFGDLFQACERFQCLFRQYGPAIVQMSLLLQVQHGQANIENSYDLLYAIFLGMSIPIDGYLEHGALCRHEPYL